MVMVAEPFGVVTRIVRSPPAALGNETEMLVEDSDLTVKAVPSNVTFPSSK